MIQFFKGVCFFTLLYPLAACQTANFSNFKGVRSTVIGLTKPATNSKQTPSGLAEPNTTLPLDEVLVGALADTNKGSNFVEVLAHAINSDPAIIGKRRDLESKLAQVGVSVAQKEFQVGATFYGGIEDVTDNTKGLAVALSATRLVFDGGRIDSQIESAHFTAEVAKMNLMAAVNERAYRLCELWLELEKYKKLQQQIDRRLAVLDPLIAQLEKVAEAGIGDVSKVTAAQRTVSAIRVKQTSVAEGLAQAEIAFLNGFGILSEEVLYDYSLISELVPNSIDDKMVQQAPLIRAKYAGYQSSLAGISALRAKGGFNVGFEAKTLSPFAGSGYDSDEQVGLVANKTIFNGGMLEAEIKQAEAQAQTGLAEIKATYRTVAKAIEMAKKNIQSMNKSIIMANENAKLTSDEIVYLKQQLVIGGSTLDSVLSAEAKLYEAESKEIELLTEKYKSELIIISSLGLLSNTLEF